MPMTEQPLVATVRAQQATQTNDYQMEPPVQTMLRLIVGCLVLACGILLAQRLPNPDLFSDYVAVCRWWQRFPTQSWVAAISGCDPLVDYRAFGPNPHPPFSTLLLLPLGLFAWPEARWVWFGISGCCLLGAWHFHRVPVVVCAATALFGVFGLYRGTLEPFLFALMLMALTREKARPLHAASLIGLAAAIKIYPGLLLASFLLERRYRAFLTGVAAAGAATMISAMAIGLDVLGEWVSYTAPHAHFMRSNPDNLSLARIAGNIAPQFSPLSAAIFVFVLTLLLLARKKGFPISMQTLLPATLLATPLVWSHYIIHTGLLMLTRLEQVLFLAGGSLIFLSSLNLLPIQNAAVAYGPVLAALVLLWYRAWRDGLHLSTEPV